ncbi:hypothetical protein ACFQZQ_10065 [Lysobacter koreensis]|uniref:Uncharacterized protein n=1 Tax=Lysobacter koreensis TaxID=266122 RepID=A0ABW2YMN1_9GAMM
MTAVLGVSAAASAPVRAQDAQSMLAEWGIDASALMQGSEDLLLRAPDPAIDGLFQAVHASARTPAEARALCGLFEPDADRSLAGLNQVATQLGEASRARFADAAAQAFVAAAQNPRQPYDPTQAQQWMKAAGVRAALLNDGFSTGLTGADRDARCRAIGQLLDALQSRPLGERAAVTRLLLGEGLARIAAVPAQ